jgi:Flp pilus assembly protein TadD
MPHGKSGDQQHFDELLAGGKALFGEKKYDDAIHDLEDAQKLHPQDDQVKQLLDQARGERDRAALADTYQSDLKAGREALTRGDYAAALAAAEKALTIKPADADAERLRADAQAKQTAVAAANQKEADYQAALKNGSAALAKNDFATALAAAEKALSLKPDDAEAKRLRDEAEAKKSASNLASQAEADYQSAMKNGQAAFARGDYAEASTKAKEALALKAKDAAATTLLGDAQTKMRALAVAAQQETDYQAALKNGHGFFARGDFTNALAEAGKALSLKPGDADAKRLQDDTQAQLAAISLAMQKEADYQSAIKAAQAFLGQNDYTNALAQAEKGLALKPDDADAKRWRDLAKSKLIGNGPRTFTNSIQMEFVWVPGVGPSGAFVGKYEVTQRQYQAILGDLPDGQTPAEGNLPVAGVTFAQANNFCAELSKRENKHYTLPTRQEWLAAAGVSEDAVTNAWDTLSAGGALSHEATSLKPHPPRLKPAPVGSICDMLGNVREWVNEEQRAGFSYHSTGGGRTGDLFLPGPVSDAPWIEQETGLRCFLLQNPPP